MEPPPKNAPASKPSFDSQSYFDVERTSEGDAPMSYSRSVRELLDLARQFSRDGTLSSAHVFAAYVHWGRDRPPSYVARAISDRAREDSALQRWVELQGRSGEREVGQLESRDVLRAMQRAGAIAFAARGSKVVHARDLMVALLAPSTDGLPPPLVQQSLADAGVSVDALRALVRSYLRGAENTDKPGVMDAVLSGEGPATVDTAPAPAPARKSGDSSPQQPATPSVAFIDVAGIQTDTIDRPDQLDIAPDVNALASVVAARSVKPPLAIGLFGDWGTGKSFFMSSMEQRIGELCKAEALHDEDGKPYYFRDIAQIRFNAWHYVDANLWASLVSRIFEELAAFGSARGKTDVRQRLRERLQSAEVVLDDARKQLAVATSGVQQAQAHSRAVAAEERKVLADFARKVGEQTLQTAGAELQKAFDLASPRFTVKDLLTWQRKLSTAGGRLRESLKWIRARGWKRTVPALAGLLLLGLGAAWGAGKIQVWIESQVLRQLLAGVAPLLLSAAGFLARHWALATKALDALEGARKELEAADGQLLAETRAKLDALEADRSGAEAAVKEAQAEVDRARKALDEADPDRRLAAFVAERNGSEQYRQHLGIVSLIRNDFSALSDLLSDAAESDAAGLPSVDRIVLYIDDLDRCPEGRVVEVLEAVHLLLAFPLFIVVVGVDSRWLQHALRERYRSFRETEAATPEAYLEKIFQIPFTLRRMDPAGFGRLIDSHFKVRDDAAPQQSSAAAVRPPAGTGAVAPAVGGGVSGTTTAPANVASSAPSPGGGAATGLRVQPRLLRITEAERAFMRKLAPLIATPRAANRFANSYRLLRVRLTSEREAAFLGTNGVAEYPLVALLLASLIGYPKEFSDLLAHAAAVAAKDGTWRSMLDDWTRRAGTTAMAAALERVAAAEADAVSVESVHYWLSVVCRFSFHLRDDALGAAQRARTPAELLRSTAEAGAAPNAQTAPTGRGAPQATGKKERFAPKGARPSS